jgi:Xaa-Pro dipeptidase
LPRPEKDDPTTLLLDAGATVLGYASDVTRTHVVGSGATADAFRAVLARMEAMQKTLCARIKVGEPYEALHDLSHQLLAEVLLESGIFRRGQVSAAELVAGGATRKLLPHGLGHSLGLQTHDVGCLKTPPRGENPWLRNTTVIAEGQVFTIEPGLYLIDTLLAELRALPQAAAADWTLIEALRPFGGIRIEDDVWVGGAGHTRNLTREALGD